ncbi:MAG: TonB-dependent receptor [Telmatospirillum sp.]|nr:TonB-dependent receptor [Telmatospirillum sp.]
MSNRRSSTAGLIPFVLFAASATTTAPAAAVESPDLAQPGRIASAAAPGWDLPASTVIVTGTRETGLQAKDSPTSIEIIGGDALTATGQTNPLDALKSLLPALNTPAMGGDLANLARSFALRGLSPNHTLVLINGARRHTSSNITIGSSPYTGANPADLDTIPLAAIDHIEVLRDGAAAQYGTDAIAGVVNIILKNADHGSSVSALGGATYRSDGITAQADGSTGARLGEDGFIRLSGDTIHHDHTNRSGYDPRVNYSVRGRIFGDAAYDTETLGFNWEKPVPGTDVTFYGFGTFAHRDAESYENYRTPTQLGPAVRAVYPGGFFPREAIDERDYALTGGVRGKNLVGWDWSLGTTYGNDNQAIRTIHSINSALLAATGNSQSDFDDGTFASEQLTTTLDVRRAVDTGLWAAPVTVAVGAEHRYETYRLSPGEPSSYLLGGASSFPGFTPASASNSQRNVAGTYLNLSSVPLTGWQVDLAGRYEHYDDVGDTEIGRIASRYDVVPGLGIRASFGNGFHAPTLAQEHFAATSVGSTSASAQLPVSSVGARILGAPPLKPETSVNFDAGLVGDPTPSLHYSLDAYQISIADRIINSGALLGPLALQAISANGNIAPPTIPPTNVSAQFFTNGVDTKTRGVDLDVDYKADISDTDALRLTLAGNYNITTITKIHQAPRPLAAAGVHLLDQTAISYLTLASPRSKVTLGATYLHDDWELTLRETRYGSVAEYIDPIGNGKNYYLQKVDAAYITDLNIRYHLTSGVDIDAGVNNVFDNLPNRTRPITRGVTNGNQYTTFSPYGFAGGSYYTRISARF